MLKWFFSFIIYVNFKFNIEKIFVNLVDIICNIYIYVGNLLVKKNKVIIKFFNTRLNFWSKLANIFIFFYVDKFFYGYNSNSD